MPAAHVSDDLIIWQVPALGEDPDPEMVDWLNSFPEGTWDGDDSGIVIYGGVNTDVIVAPGEYICSIRSNGIWRLAKWIPAIGSVG